jgi:hypothetical protein
MPLRALLPTVLLLSASSTGAAPPEPTPASPFLVGAN